jgi:hypothetical protein
MSSDPSNSSGGRGRSGNENKSGVSDQVLSLPNGGGALEGTGGKFATRKQTGAGSYSLPIEVPDGRNGLQPELELAYSTGNSDGAFGLGWALGVPAISRKTKIGVPVYDDDEDTFLLSGGEDLVSVEQHDGDNGTAVTRYRPRVEGDFARIEHHRGEETDLEHGSGVGLWLVRWVVEHSDGALLTEPTAEGTRMGLRLERAHVATATDAVQVDSTAGY